VTNHTIRTSIGFLITCFAAALPVAASPVLGSAYASYFTMTELGAVPGATRLYGGLTFAAGDTNTLLIGTDGNYAGGAIQSIGVVRDADGHITGFSGTAATVASAMNIDGGLEYGPGGNLFFTQYYMDSISQLKPGSTSPDETQAVPTGGSVGGLNFVPSGIGGAGNMVVTDYQTGEFAIIPLTLNGNGTYDMGSPIESEILPNGPEGFVYIPAGTAGFTTPSILVAEFRAGGLASYQLDADGLPILSTRKVFLTGLPSVANVSGGPEGLKIDPVTNDILMTLYDGSEVFRFTAIPTPEPGTISLMSLALVLGGIHRFRRKRA